ncbi:MAG: CatB-related O-acetyltransferase [Candidatus Paceibacterota bacterium]
MTFQFGEYSYGTKPKVLAWTTPDKTVTCGKYCSIADNVTILLDGNHNIKSFSSFPFKERLGWSECPPNNWGKSTPIIGNDVWIGQNSFIYSGVTIGDGAVIAGNSVVTKSVPPYGVVAGNPAKLVKYRFSPEEISDLLNIQWWDLPQDVIRTTGIPHLNNISAFISEMKKIKENNKTS